MSDLIDRLKGNGKPWTFAEIIEALEDAEMSNNILKEVRENLGTPSGKSITYHAKQMHDVLDIIYTQLAFFRVSRKLQK